MRLTGIFPVLFGLGCSLVGCDHSGARNHMMGGGMMGGGMMGQPLAANGSQSMPEPDSDATRLFRQFCGQCHAPPSPSAHKAQDWPPVVARMKQHMETQGKAMPNDDQNHEILEYLQRHAG